MGSGCTCRCSRTCTATASWPSPRCPRPTSPAATAAQAIALAGRWPRTLGYVGVLCVEFFVLADGSLVANEMAPRPHNSGHYSIDACDVSQFDLQVRTLAGLPLVAPRQHSAGGDAQPAGRPVVRRRGRGRAHTRLGRVLALPGVHLHLYGKAEPRRAARWAT
jgi:5-(carboxyamino)imidazole ribonucleotide synthase